MCKSRKCSKSMSGTQTRQNSEIVFQGRGGGNWEPAEFEPPLSTVGECVAHKAISSLPDSYALANGE